MRDERSIKLELKSRLLKLAAHKLLPEDEAIRMILALEEGGVERFYIFESAIPIQEHWLCVLDAMLKSDPHNSELINDLLGDAACMGSVISARFLLERGACPSHIDRYGNTPQDYAEIELHVDVITVLNDFGAGLVDCECGVELDLEVNWDNEEATEEEK
jgi:hypothetical protein